MDYFIIFIYGIVIGSFLNVCIYRLPLDESIIKPSSHCTSCNTPLKPLDLVPVFSWIFLRGRCRYCGSKVSYRYAMVEMITGLLFIFTYYHFGWNFILPINLFLICVLLVSTFIDIDHLIIPDILNIVGIVGFAIFNLIFGFIPWGDSILGGIIGGLPILLIVVITRGAGMGMGDTKLMFMIGLYLGWKLAILTVFLSFVLGGIIGVFLLILKIKKRDDPIPFGPWISFAAVIVIFYGNNILAWYLGLTGLG